MELLPEMRTEDLDTVIVTYGSATIYEKELRDIGMILRVDLKTDTFDPAIPRTEGVISVEEAVKLGADGVISMSFTGAEQESTSQKLTHEIARDAKEWN
jgi:fructose-bisphosphate aldolase, class I